MDVNVLREKRSDLQNKISTAVSKVVEEFKGDTGFSPASISIQMIESSIIGGAEPQYIVGRVFVEIRI